MSPGGVAAAHAVYGGPQSKLSVFAHRSLTPSFFKFGLMLEMTPKMTLDGFNMIYFFQCV
ncbi:hypothetical protein J21TS3_45080 [Paenibacillus cookii]|uniref:Uncharacterized protein n=1 Tax=Paenibacillus cookii TaxID=157839 RepID=A0ABQ4M2C9_9BACL|nr:hypothetical protein J21TS3_45080 [Paenibacillus cookii]